MDEPSTEVSTTKPDPSAEVVTTRVNVAFPFSQIRIQEPSEDLAALAALLRDLADLVAESPPERRLRTCRRALVRSRLA
jgi:hypothetical protein